MSQHSESKQPTRAARLTAVGVGPGDPDLITMKGIEAIPDRPPDLCAAQ